VKSLVVGYGNVLRGDDGVGPWVAEALAATAPPDVRVLTVHQLTPELAEPLAEAEIVIFVDAHRAELGSCVKVCRVNAEPTADPLGHAVDPARLLALTQALYGATPDTFLVMIPAASFEVGETLSPLAQVGADAALRMIRRMLSGEAAGVPG
jgi:hydrogenase maturation protease